MWRLKISLIAALCVTMISFNGCKKKQVEREVTYRPDNFPEILVPPENAIDVRYSNPEFYKPATDGYLLFYQMVEEYPAKETIEQIRNDLKIRGCIKIGDGEWGKSSSKPKTAARLDFVHFWWEIWIAPSDEVVETLLRYKYTEGKKEMNKLLVTRTVFTSSSMIGWDRARQYKEKHPELFEERQDKETLSDDGNK